MVYNFLNFFTAIPLTRKGFSFFANAISPRCCNNALPVPLTHTLGMLVLIARLRYRRRLLRYPIARVLAADVFIITTPRPVETTLTSQRNTKTSSESSEAEVSIENSLTMSIAIRHISPSVQRSMGAVRVRVWQKQLGLMWKYRCALSVCGSVEHLVITPSFRQVVALRRGQP